MLESMYVKLLVAYGEMLDRLDRQEGQALVEYALIISFVALLCIAALQFTGNSVTTIFNNVTTDL